VGRHLDPLSARGVSPRRKLRHEASQKITFVKFLIKLFSKSLWGVGQSPTTCNRRHKTYDNSTGQKAKGLMNDE
jgi:hypothetical protein